ncbi:O-antigen ligase family protein [Patescibacteria group bacterium]|nr:O-antigen ligase family protein [Patescibacteria group bacterium]
MKRSWLYLLEKESYLYLVFIAMSFVINGNKKYMVMLFGFVALSYLISGNLIRALWLTFVSAFLFDKVVVLLINYPVLPSIANQLPMRDITMNFAFSFADVLLIPLIFVARKNSVRMQWGLIDWLIIFFIVLGVASSINSSVPYNYSWFGFLKSFIYVVIYYLARMVSVDRRVYKATIEIIVLFAVFNVILMILQTFHHGPLGLLLEDMTFPYGRFADEISSLYRPGGVSWNANLTGTILLMVLPLFLSFSIINMKKGYRWLGTWVTLLLLVGIGLTASRFIWLVLFGVGLLLGWRYRRIMFLKISKLGKWKVVVVCLIGGAVVIPFIINRLSTLGEGNIYLYRVLQYTTAEEMIKNRFFGVGWDGYRYFALDNYSPKVYGYAVTPPHNLFLEVGSSIGIGGIVFIGVLLVWVARLWGKLWGKRQWKTWELMETGILSSLLVYFLVNQAYTSWYSVSMTKLFWLLLGFSYVGRNRQAIS